MPNEDQFFLGKQVDPATGKSTDQPLFYDPADLTTHAVVTGMTGSGKTGLCIGLLEEAALQNVPAIIIDPKGDLTNLLLHFPNLLPADFEPWMDPDAARKANKTTSALAEEIAGNWQKGLSGWGIDSTRIAKLSEKVDFTIYTPGSDSGIPVSILASLNAPEIPWEGNREVLMEKISSTVSALLGLVGLTDVDPVRSREHILLSNIFQQAWSQGKDLDLSELILQTQNPPFEKLGVFPLDKFFPEKDRIDLAILLNNFLASPSFQGWMNGEPLNISTMLYTATGKPRHSIFYTAHLNDAERMFFITLLYSSIEAWMRTQTGTTGLRALVYFDEIMGYLPPVGNPSSKMVILRMLKQARAFGVGLLLATQNPVDVDYKALSNAGTWFIGKLQTDQDKQRLLDGLETVTGGVNRSDFDKMISGLGKRVFLLHNVHNPAPILMGTRWTMNYLAGPLTRVQIPALNKLAGAAARLVSTSSSTAKPADSAVPGIQQVSSPSKPNIGNVSKTKPQVPKGITEVFLPNNLTLSEAVGDAKLKMPANPAEAALVYQPALIGQVQIRYLERRYGIDQLTQRQVLVEHPDPRGLIQWGDHTLQPMDAKSLAGNAVNGFSFAELNDPLTDAKLISSLQKDFTDWVFQTGELRILANLTLKQFGEPGMNETDFKKKCIASAEAGRNAEIQKVSATITTRLKTIKQKIAKEEAELSADKADLNTRTMEEVGAGLDLVMGLFGGRKKSVSTNLTKRRQAANAKADVVESEQALVSLKQQAAELENDLANQVNEIQKKWNQILDDVTEIPVVPAKTNIFLEVFGVAWCPQYHITVDGNQVQIPAWRA